MSRVRSVEKMINAREQPEGKGAKVRRAIGSHEAPYLDPFLLLDIVSVKPPAGFPDHPHRGFETVTYLIKGAFNHEDFNGNKGSMAPGDLQLMTAGRGMVHCEVPAAEGGDGLQLWVNLAKEKKMMPAAYQDIKKKDVNIVQKNGVTIAECLTEHTRVRTQTPIVYLDIILESGAEHFQPLPEDWNAFCYIYAGKVAFGPVDQEQERDLGYCIIWKKDGDCIRLRNPSMENARVMLVGGKPLNDTISRHGPFVMNTREEIDQAIQDFQNGANGFENAIGWQSDHVKGLRR